MFALFDDAFPCFLLAVGSLTSFGHPRLCTFATFGDGVLITIICVTFVQNVRFADE